MKEFTFKASIDALEERVAILEAKVAAIPTSTSDDEPLPANYDQEETNNEEEEPEE